MPIMMGFAHQRRRLLETELARLVQELPPLGVLKAYLSGDFALGQVGAETELELVLVQATDEPFHRRADFFVSHLRPRIGTRFLVYTPEEFDALSGADRTLRQTVGVGELLFES